MIRTIRRVAELIGPDGWGRWVVVLVMALAVMVTEALAALAVVSLADMVVSGSEEVSLPVFGQVRSQGGGFVALAAGIATFFAARGVLVVAQAYVQNRIAYRAGARLSGRLLGRYLRMPYEWHLTHNSAELIGNASETVSQTITYAVLPLIGIAADGIVVFGLSAVVFSRAPVATALGAAVLFAVIAVFLRVLKPRLLRLGSGYRQSWRSGLQILQHGTAGIRDIRILGRASHFQRQFSDSRMELARINYLRVTANELPRIAMETLLVLGLLVFLTLREATPGGAEAALPLLGLVGYTVLRVLPALNRILSRLNQLRYGQAFVEQVHADFAESDLAAQPDAPSGGRLDLGSELKLVDVSYSYPPGGTPVVRNVTFDVARGASVGITGPTGSGKSTVMDLMLGLLAPSAGTILVDGSPLTGREALWHRSLGVVSQSPFISDDTLRRNVAFGLADHEIDDSLVLEALHTAQFGDVLASLPEGLDTPLGERGSRLSGGECQRLAIARALYNRPSALFLDEGTSALDSSTEAALLDALDALPHGCTVVAITHRIGTLRKCDQIVMMTGGRVTGIGSYAELQAANPEFQRLASMSAG